MAGSQLLTGFVSAVHVLGMTVLAGGALVSGLRLLGVLLSDRPAVEILRPIARGMTLGLIVSVASGLVLFAPRATTAIQSSYFQLKMQLLLIAIIFHFVVWRRLSRRRDAAPFLLRLGAGASVLALWFGVALAACAFILLE